MAGDGEKRNSGAFDAFLSGLTDAVGGRFGDLQSALPSGPDPVFQNDAKVVRDWPDIAARIMEELR